ncbi:5006_t:CDS:1, partial [Dentiscutata heterogama]
TNITSHNDKVRNIKTWKCLSKSKIYQLSLPVKFDDNLQFIYDIISAYDNYIEKKAALIHRRVEFYKQISYTLLNDNDTFDTYMNLHSCDIVQIQEETGLSYAILKRIFMHRYNDGLVYSFIWVDWLRKYSILDPILQCPVYEKQTAKNTRWHRVYPISLIDNLSKVHFVHYCHSTCTSTSHNSSNNQYIRNKFYYEAI